MEEYSEEQKLNLLLDEYRRLQSVNHETDRTFLSSPAITLVGLTAGLFMSSGNDTMSLMAPFMYLYVVYNVIKYTTKIVEINATLTLMEDKINEMTGEVLLLEKRYIKKYNSYFWGGNAQAPFFAAFLIIFLIPYGQVSMDMLHNESFILKCIAVLIFVLLIISCVFIGIMAKNLSDEENKVLEYIPTVAPFLKTSSSKTTNNTEDK